jgi:hypothetical protein
MTPGNRRFVRTALAILGLMALASATVWIVLFMFVRPARGDTVDARMFYVIDGDTLALAGERIRLLGHVRGPYCGSSCPSQGRFDQVDDRLCGAFPRERTRSILCGPRAGSKMNPRSPGRSATTPW